MFFPDSHTHYRTANPYSILNSFSSINIQHSRGIHPWFIQSNYLKQLKILEEDLVFGTNNNERFKIGFDGIVGMGTTTAGVLKIGVTTLGAFTAMSKLQVYGADANQCSAIFKHPNDTQGIGIAYDGLVALGNGANQNIVMRPRGSGGFSIEYGAVTKFSVNSAGGLTISPDTIAITSGGGGQPAKDLMLMHIQG